MASLDLSLLVQGVTLAALLWFGRGFINLRDEVIKLRVILTGENGANGVRGEVTSLRSRSHEHGDKLHNHAARITMLEHDLTDMQRAR